MHEDWYSGPSPTWQFPNGTLFKKCEGEVITVREKQFLITRDIHESFWQGVEQWKVVFEGIDLQTSEPVVIKIRYVLDQHAIPPRDRGLRRRIMENYSAEVDSLQSCYGCRYFPKYIAHEEKRQCKEEPNPGAPVYIVVMSKIDALPLIAPGRIRPTDIFPGPLTAEDKQIIRIQCLDAIVALRQRGIPSFITLYNAYYNIRTKMLYFLGHSRMSREITEFSTPGPVTESSREFLYLIDNLE
ncbi:hypothetical protein DTO212C5_4273 [Paecilomyces variotii]|nr:hypothetical protein DTO212C5_4273 [Paecilomyces variotii]